MENSLNFAKTIDMKTFFSNEELIKIGEKITRGDYAAISERSRLAGLKDGQGYSAPMIAGAVKKGFKISQALKDLILDYYQKKEQFEKIY